MKYSSQPRRQVITFWAPTSKTAPHRLVGKDGVNYQMKKIINQHTEARAAASNVGSMERMESVL